MPIAASASRKHQRNQQITAVLTKAQKINDRQGEHGLSTHGAPRSLHIVETSDPRHRSKRRTAAISHSEEASGTSTAHRQSKKITVLGSGFSCHMPQFRKLVTALALAIRHATVATELIFASSSPLLLYLFSKSGNELKTSSPTHEKESPYEIISVV